MSEMEFENDIENDIEIDIEKEMEEDIEKDIFITEHIYYELLEFVESQGLPLCEYMQPSDIGEFLYKITNNK